MILFIASGIPDYGAYFIYHGLCKIMGHENIIDYPCKLTWHGYDPPWIFIEPTPRKCISENEISNIDFDFILVMSRIDAIEYYLRYKEKAKYKSIPTILYHAEDSHGLNEDHLKEVKPDIVFKREYLLNISYPLNCYPLPFSSPFPLEDNFGTRGTDVYFRASDNHYARRIAHETLSSMPDDFNIISSCGEEHLSWREYFHNLTQSKIVVDVLGYGYDTVRKWEALSAHSMLITTSSPQIIPNPLIHGKHCIYIKHFGRELRDLSEYLLLNYSLLLEIADQGFDHLREYHTTEKRAEYFLGILEDSGYYI